MSTTITHAEGTIAPSAVEGYFSSREAGNIIHDVPGAPGPDVTLRSAGLRTGRLVLVFTDEATSKAAEDAHVTGGTFALVSTDRPTIDMTYVVAGRLERELGGTGEWRVTVEWQEVLA